MKFARKSLALLMALILTFGTFGIVASAASGYEHEKDVFQLTAGSDYATAPTVAPGETVYSTIQAGETGYFCFSVQDGTQLTMDFESSAPATVKIALAGTAKYETYSDVTDCNIILNIKKNNFYWITVQSAEKCEFTFTPITNALIQSNFVADPSVAISAKTATLYATESLELVIANDKPQVFSNFFWEVVDDTKTPFIDESEFIDLVVNPTDSHRATITVVRNNSDFNTGSFNIPVRAYFYYNGELYGAECIVTAIPANIDISPYYDSTDKNSLTLGVNVSKEITFSTKLKGATIKWESSDETVAQVVMVKNKVVVTGVSAGNTNIVAYLYDSNGTAIAKRTIRVDVDPNYQMINGVSFSSQSLSMRVGNTKTLEYKIDHTPKDQYPYYATVTFTSSKPEVATVNESGTVKAVAPGETTITVTVKTAESEHTAKCVVTVKEALPDWLTLIITPLEILYNLIMGIFGK